MLENGVFGSRIGVVGLADFDLGLVKSLGATIVDKRFVLNYEGLEPNIPVIFENPEQPLIRKIIPSMTITRDDESYATQRTVRNVIEYRVPAPGAVPVIIGDTTGYSKYVVKQNARPADIMYNVQIYHRYRPKIQLFKQVIVDLISKNNEIFVTDSIGCVRSYSAYLDNLSKMDEVLSPVQRTMAFSMSIRVEAEIDIWTERVESDIVRNVIINGSQI